MNKSAYIIVICILLTACASKGPGSASSDVLLMTGLGTDPSVVAQLQELERKPGNKDDLFRFAFSPASNTSFQTIYGWLQDKAYVENSRDMRHLAAMSYLAQRGRRNDIAAQAYVMAMYLANAEAARCADPSSANRRIVLMQSQLREVEALVFAQPRDQRARNLELAIEHQQATEASPPAYHLCQGSFSDQLSALKSAVENKNNTDAQAKSANEVSIDTTTVQPQLVPPAVFKARLAEVEKRLRAYYLK